ncbi:hypothetical protein H4582DRAFT_1817282 [Lactarius indigo]|nr:hypothetical protein H4582DRAFT_1817282 [Lactarius indigo]
MPRNSVSTLWNEAMVNQHSHKTGQTQYIVYALDSCEKKPLTRQQQLVIAHLKLEQTNRLPNKIHLAVGMKVMILENIAPNAEVLEDENANTIRLHFPPAAIFFIPQSNRKQKIDGLPMGTVPVFPSHKKFQLGGSTGTTVDHHQLPLTLAYAFTDYKSQGQTIECVIVNLAKPPSGCLTPFDAYVSLSRSRGRQTIQFLWDFEDSIFTTSPNADLRNEDL